MSLRLKTILGIALIEGVLLVLLITMVLNYLRDTNYEALEKRAATTATLFASTTKDAVLSYDLASLDEFVNEVMNIPDLVYARVIGPDNQVFAQAGNSELLARPFKQDKSFADVNDAVFDAFVIIEVAGVIYGRVEIGIDTTTIESTIKEAQYNSSVIALIEMGLVALFSMLLGLYLTNQLKALQAAAKTVSSGDLSISIPVKGQDEVADVARAFNAMVSALRSIRERRDQIEKDLQELNATLESRVEKRTIQLQTQNLLLQKANEDLKDAQAKLVHSEKMASVGVLAAGVAHEINNPLSIIIGNVDNLAEYANAYRHLLEEYEALEKSLASASYSEEPVLAQQLQTIKTLAENYDLTFINEDLDSLLNDTREGCKRVKDIVSDLRAFAQSEDQTSFEPANVNDCIQSAIKMAQNEFREHCEIELDLGELPLILCHRGRLIQVFVNLLVNAGHAIEVDGKISIHSSLLKNLDNEQSGTIVVTISDNGKGIEAENLGRIFDPFFTTKPVGKGTGLGLSISYGIIEEHGGELSVESEVGIGTTFTIKLPCST